MPGNYGFTNVSEKASNEYILINNCGYFKNADISNKTCRPNGRSDYQLIYIAHGYGAFQLNGKERILSDGEVIIFKPGEPQIYTYYPTSNSIYWIHFTGTGVENILRNADLWDKQIYNLGLCVELGNLIIKITKELQLQSTYFSLFCVGYFYELISIIARELHRNNNESLYKNRKRLESVIKDMHENYQSQKPVADYANLCNLSVSRFIHLFKECTGKSPLKYRQEIRFNKSKDLLISTSLSIKEISEIVGYNDPLQFSRKFKDCIGCSPKEYRNTFGNDI